MAWLSSDWAYRREITIDNTSNSNDLTDYQVKITLDNTNFDFSHANSDGSDIRFTDDDGSTLLYHWIEKWDSTNEEAIVWVKVSSIPGSSAKTIYMYYGNPSASDASDVSNTFIREIDGLVGSWHFDEGSGTTACDTSGNDNDGTINGATWVNDGKFGKALSFDGADDYVEVKDSDSLDITNAITIMAWVKLDSLDKEQQIVRKSRDDTGEAYEIFINDTNRVFFGIRDSSGTEEYVYPTDTLTTGTWYHIVGTYDKQNLKLYLNGNEIGSEPSTITIDVSSRNLIIGCGDKGTRYFHGTIDEVRIYNRALSEGEISDLYNNYGYTTENYPGKVLVRKYTDPEPVFSSVGSIEGIFYISGQVTLNGNPVQGAKVRAICQDDNSYVGDVTTDANGNYTIENLLGDKKYHIVVEYTDPDTGQKYNAESKWDITPVEESS